MREVTWPAIKGPKAVPLPPRLGDANVRTVIWSSGDPMLFAIIDVESTGHPLVDQTDSGNIKGTLSIGCLDGILYI